MNKDARIYVAGHRGLVGSAIVRRLQADGHTGLLLRTHAELDLIDEPATRAFFAREQPEFVFLAAAKVGGIVANNSYPAQFIRDNLAIQTNVIHSAHLAGVQRLLFLGSSCIYPKLAPQPMRERDLLTGPLEPTNRPYALAKIAGVEMCWSYNREYGRDGKDGKDGKNGKNGGTQYLAVMPTNLYGPGDNYHPTNSHVIPALLRKFHEAKVSQAPQVTVWGTGTPRREFLFSDDMADACVYLMNLPDERFLPLLGSDESVTGRFEPPLVNIGVGEDITIAELAVLVAQVVGYDGAIVYDSSKPDGTLRKLMDVGLMKAAGWQASTRLEEGLRVAYAEFVKKTA